MVLAYDTMLYFFVKGTTDNDLSFLQKMAQADIDEGLYSRQL